MGQGCDEHWILDMRKRVTIGLKKKKKRQFSLPVQAACLTEGTSKSRLKFVFASYRP